MDAGQITQGLRADAFQQGGQGANFMQLMESGVSFADIMRMITADNQNAAGIMPNLSGIMPDMSMDSEIPLMGNNENLFENMQDLINLSAFQNLAAQYDMQEIKNLLLSVGLNSVKDNVDNQTSVENPFVSKSDLSEVGNIYQLANDLNKADIEKFIDSLKNIKNSDEILVFDEQADSKKLNVVQNPNGIQDLEKIQSSKESQNSENIQAQNTKEIQDVKEVQNTENIPDSKEIQDSDELQGPENTQKLQNIQWSKDMSNSNDVIDNIDLSNNLKEDVSSESISNVQELPNYELNEADVQNENKVSDEHENVHYQKDISNRPMSQKLNLKNSFNAVDIQVVNNGFNGSDGLSDVQVIQKLENFLDLQNVQEFKNSEKSEKSAFYSRNDFQLNQNENVINVNNLMNAQAIQIISEKLGIVKNSESMAAVQTTANAHNLIPNAQLSQKLADIFSVMSPEIMKAAENEGGMINNENKFVIDLLSELSNEKDRRDIFDFSESVVKVDPLQLAGLLDFISTGTGIPQAMDVSDNTMFKNIDSSNAAEKISGKMIFDPKEMIESGEMEIVSYVPAEKKTQSNTQSDNNRNFSENGEKTIDFARTMKSVKENVKPVADDTEKAAESPAMTVQEMNNLAERIDISFDRAYAELEMNKTKYGSADEQLFKGIAENIKKGKSEFTVKLRPEGLGEILVKLVSDDGGKTILSMVASSEKTAQLLNRDLASLQSSLNEHNVEIENNTVKTVENVNASHTSFSQYDERRQDEGNQQNQFRNLRRKLGNISVGNVSFDNETEPVKSASIDSALNITI